MGEGSYMFKLSDMMPNSWFYKLRDMRIRRSRGSRRIQNSMEKGQVSRMETGKSLVNQNPTPKPTQKQAYIKNRPSYYIPSSNREEKSPYSPTLPKATDTQFPIDTPRKPKRKPLKKSVSTHNMLVSSSAPSVCTCQKERSSVLGFDDELITIDQNPPFPLPPIVTKPHKKETNKPHLTVRNQSSKHGISPRIKMRINSPKHAKKRVREKKGLTDSFVVVKSSSDPQRDFRESMLEMIFQNNLWTSKDLEELLACYLSLNSDEYHNLIVKVFEQIWFDLTDIILKFK